MAKRSRPARNPEIVELDSLDKEILYALDHDARQSVADLARLLDVSRDRISYRVEKLVEDGVITNFSASLNPYKLGLVAYKTYLRLRNDRRRIAQITRYLSKHPHIFWVAECEGSWDFIFVAFSRTPRDFHLLQNSLLEEFSEIILDFAVYTLVDVTFFRKRYFLMEGSAGFSFGGEPQALKLDKVDLSLAEQLASDCRRTYKEISRSARISESAVASRIARLEELGVILGYRIGVDYGKLGMTMFKVQVQLQKFSDQGEEQILQFCRKNPFIALFIRQIGDYKLELEMETYGYDHLNEIRRELREEFPYLIKQMDATVIREQYYRFTPFAMAFGEAEDSTAKSKRGKEPSVGFA